jgi:hypothetical protein
MKEINMTKKELIIRLIKDDLLNQRLISNFKSIGFYSDDYHLNLSETIFKIMGIDDSNDEILEQYIRKNDLLVRSRRFKNSPFFEKTAESIYEYLLKLNSHAL